MARNSGATKFASVNLNQSYGKPPQQAASSPGVVGSGGRSRLPGTTHGGMLLLTRPARPQPAGQKNPKLAVPRPVNLPSLRREHAGNDPTVSLVGGSGASGWIKQQQQISEDLLVDSVSSTTGAFADTSVAGKISGSSWGLSQQSATLDGELRPLLHPASGGRSGVYTPPGARSQQGNATLYLPAAVPPPVAVEKVVLLRGEEFPTLQASLPPAPAPPQQRQKELQQKQRDKQRELKEQQEKLHQLTQKQHDEDADKIQHLKSQSQPLLSLQPQLKHEQAKKSQNEEKFPVEGFRHTGERSFREEERSLPSRPAPLIRLNQTSNWADDERDVSTDLKSQEIPIKPQEAAFLDWIDREPEPFGFRRPFQRDIPSNFGRNVDFRKGATNNKEGSQGWKQNNVKETVGHGNARDRQETNVLKDTALGVEGGCGRDSTFGRERTTGKDNAYAKSPTFGIGGGGFTRDEGYDKVHTFSRDGAVRGGNLSMDSGIQAMDIGGNRAMSLNKEVYLGRHGSHNKGTSYEQDNHGGMNGFTNSRAKSFDRENYGGGMGGVMGRDLRESYGGMNGQNINRDGYKDGFNVGRAAYREAQGSFGRDGVFSKAGQNGDFDGAKAFNRFRNGGGRDSFQEFGMIKAGRGDFLDKGRGRTARSKLHSTDPYTRAFTEFVGVDYRATSMLGLEIFESKGLRRKKDIKENTFRDLERESFEAELERVQKLLEEDRQRKIEEQERAIELARKEQEERERLAKEEEERQLRLEAEAREAAAKAEQEALEAVRKAEEIRRAREEEKQQMFLEEERRKENARRKLLELEERIAKRQAESKRKEEEELGQLRRGDLYYEVNSPRVEDAMGSLDDVRGKVYSVDQDDDDRAPLRPPSSERPSPKFNPLHSGSSRIKSPDGLNQQIGGYDVALQQSNTRSGSLELDTSRVSSWRRGPSNNDVGIALTSKKLPYFPDDSNNARPSLPHDHGYHARKPEDWEPPHGSSYSSGFPGDRVYADKPVRKDPVESSYEWRQNLNDDAKAQLKFSNGHLRYSELERGFAENFYANRDSDHPRYEDKMANHRSWEGRPPSPLSPPPYYHGTDLVENSPSGRLRQSLPKQPRVPPPPLQAYQKSFPKSSGDHTADYSTRAHHETGTYSEQDSSSKELANLKSRQLEDSSHQALSIKPPSESSSSLESVTHSSTSSSKLEPVAKPLVESHAIRSEEEDSGEDGDEEMLEDSEAAEYEEEEASYEEKGEFEEEEDDYDDLEEEKVVGYREDSCDGIQESVERELISGDVENSKNDSISVSEIAVDSLSVVNRESSDTLTVDIVTAEEVLEPISMKVPHQSVPLNDLHSHDLMREEILLDSTVGVAEQLRESSEVQPMQLQELITPSSLPFQSIESMEPHSLSSTIPLIQEQHPDHSTITQPTTVLSATPLQASSLHAPLPVGQNHLEVPMTLQFGLLPSTSLLPASVPAIQIGSIQMPLPVHMHSHLSPHVAHYHPSHASPFQFGQLGHPIALSQLLPSFGSQPQPVVQTSMQNENVEQQQSSVISQVQSLMPSFHGHFSVEHLSQLDEHVHQPFEADKTMPESARYFQDASDKAMNGSEDEYSGKKTLEPGLQMDNKVENQSSILSGNKENQVNSSSENDSSKRISQHMASADAAVESTIGLHKISRRSSEHRKNEGGSWQRVPGNLQSEAGNLARGTELEREKEKDWHLHSEISGNNLIDVRYEGNAYRGRSNRRSSSRRSEFRPRETRETFVADERPANGSRQSIRERFTNTYGTDYNRNRSTNDKAFQRDGFKNQGMHERRFNKDSRANAGFVGIGYSRNSGGKTEKVGNNESGQKNFAQSSGGGRSRSGDGLLGRFGAMEDAPVQSGVVHVFEQPGIEIPGDEDDFIEVRSKRQMLNDRREQREKEIKEKSKVHVYCRIVIRVSTKHLI
ncbi:hypothetical protein O6H91_07G060100 [Diphasiastrum complanatum]|uniref:Uncharacterized protein n=1 Tax=Diphasiastrum complanatum TaxID=34168 RepID=A0ACC2D5N6_DIPCM|nr:hypothetical protein O6H91_07G060100 [Diphasiastrum complanatum]